MKLFVFIAVALPLIYAWPGGAPDGACEDFIPQHQGVELMELSTAEFFLHFKSSKTSNGLLARTRRGVVPIKIRPDKGFEKENFKGFLVQARTALDDQPAGSFVLVNKEDEPFRMQHLLCNEATPEATVTHTDNDDKADMKLFWKPPPENPADTEYYFHYTIVKDYETIWAARDSPKFTIQG